jgi:hypothetical protein
VKNIRNALQVLGFENEVISVAPYIYPSIREAQKQLTNVLAWNSRYNSTVHSGLFEVKPEEVETADKTLHFEEERNVLRKEMPKNLFGCKGLLVFNVPPNFEENQMKPLFTKISGFKSFQFSSKKQTLLVYFEDPSSVVEGVISLEWFKVHKTCTDELWYRFVPSNGQEDILKMTFMDRMAVYRERGECMQWRTQGCPKIGCDEKHFRMALNLDKEVWRD